MGWKLTKKKLKMCLHTPKSSPKIEQNEVVSGWEGGREDGKKNEGNIVKHRRNENLWVWVWVWVCDEREKLGAESCRNSQKEEGDEGRCC